ncbi:MAG TPA: polynucleotide adenylyltransferase PcnB [Spirochaetota bacterium]|nr:polynucleotide adenylyltransferase PcnB [Spirochaetota bacterium]
MFLVANFFKKLFGKANKKIDPKIISPDVHKIRNSFIDFNALKIINRLKRFGFDAYIVGGAIRDCLLGKKPKDFDVATNATPKEIKKIFTNGRIIGRRFKLVHIIFGDSYIEVATFRTAAAFKNKESKKENKDPFAKENNFGTIEEDVLRRDFSVNALYYNPEDQTIIDYVGGFEDINSRIIRPLNPPEVSFLEDPVRMLRAVKYMAALDCVIPENVLKKIRKFSKELKQASLARLYEEINKIIKTGKSAKILQSLFDTELLKYLIPFMSEDLLESENWGVISSLKKLDDFIENKKIENYDIFWGITLYKRLIKENFDIRDFNYIQKVNEFFMNHLFPLKVPNKTSDFLSKTFFLFNKLQDPTSKNYARKYLNHRYFTDALIFLKILTDDVENIKFWESNKNKIKVYKKNRPKNAQKNNSSNGFKKVLTTKNYVSKDSASDAKPENQVVEDANKV